MMPKNDAITAIMYLNPTANPSFLAEFPIDDLRRYLERLAEAARPPEALHRLQSARAERRRAPAHLCGS